MEIQLSKLVMKDFCEYDKLPLQENIDVILKLKKEKNAIILCHTYQRPEIRKVADFVGDSYALSVAAAKTTNPLIVFCGVHFMAETAKILNPKKKVLLPSTDAGCGLAETINAEKVKKWKAQYPGIPLILYVNSSADVKAEADIICTSTNTLKAIESIDGDKVLLAPDKNLYYNVQPKTKKEIIPWEGYCPVHKEMTIEMLEYAISQYPSAKILVHPECNPEVTKLALELDGLVLSTTGMAEHVKKSQDKEYIIGTEQGLVQMLQEMFPEKKFYSLTTKHKSCDESCICPYMKSITLGKVRRSLEQNTNEIKVSEDIRLKALIALERMLKLRRDT